MNKKKPAPIEKVPAVPVKPKESLIIRRTEPLLSQSRSVTQVTSDDHMTVTATLIQRLDEAIKWIEAVATPYTKALDAMHKMGVAWKKSQLSPLEKEKRRLLDLRQEFDDKQAKIREAAAAKLAVGLQNQERRELEKQAKLADKQGQPETALFFRTQANAVPLPQVPAAPVEQQAGFYTRERWVYTIVDPSLVEREFCSPDDSLIRPVVEAMGPACKISGLHIEKEVKQHSRSVGIGNA